MNDGLTYEGIVFDSFVKSPYMNQKGIGPKARSAKRKAPRSPSAGEPLSVEFIKRLFDYYIECKFDDFVISFLTLCLIIDNIDKLKIIRLHCIFI